MVDDRRRKYEETPSWLRWMLPPPEWTMFPQPPTPASATEAMLTPRTQQIMQRPEFQQQWGYTRPEEAPAAAEAISALPRPTSATPAAPKAGDILPDGSIAGGRTPPTEDAPEGYDWRWDATWGIYVAKLRPGATPISEYQAKQLEFAKVEATREQEQWEAQQAWRETEAATEAQWRKRELGAEEEWREEQLRAEQEWRGQQVELEREQMAWQQAEAERVEMARLSAQPISWLQYASYTGETPAIQPWMQPLMPQQYQELDVGGAIPGWSPESGAAMPELLRPSRQLQARMGPTALQQYGGYQQARTGARPEEQAWRMGAAAPPGGGRRGLQWGR